MTVKQSSQKELPERAARKSCQQELSERAVRKCFPKELSQSCHKELSKRAGRDDIYIQNSPKKRAGRATGYPLSSCKRYLSDERRKTCVELLTYNLSLLEGWAPVPTRSPCNNIPGIVLAVKIHVYKVLHTTQLTPEA